MEQNKINLGVSRCLLGEAVRYDGGHKRDRYLTDLLGPHVNFVGVCPEVECGLGVPREAMRLVGTPDNQRLIARQSGRDLTDQMLTWAGPKLDELAKAELCGFIFKSGSPSSGMIRVKLYNDKGVPSLQGVGVFAGLFMRRFPQIPCEDEGRLNDLEIRENFLTRVFTLARFRQCLARGGGLGDLMRFQAEHKLLLLAHSAKLLPEMGALLAGGKQIEPGELLRQYLELLLKTLSLRSTLKKNVNALMHAQGFLKKFLSSDEKAELLELLQEYGRGNLPLVVPITLIAHHARKHGQQYLQNQVYLRPHPLDLKLRNHA